MFANDYYVFSPFSIQADSSSNEKGYDFSIVSQYPQNIFQNVSPPAAFVGPTDVPMNIDLELRETSMVSKSPTTPQSETSQINDVTLSCPAEIIKEVADSSNLSVSKTSNTPSVVTGTPSQKAARDSPGSRKGSEISGEVSKPVRTKSSTPLGALQKWLQIGTGSDSRQNSSSSTMKQATSVMEVSKSLVKERIGVFGGGGAEKVKPVVVPPTTICSATQTSPDEQMVSPFNSGHFNIGISGSNVIQPAQSVFQTNQEKLAKASTKLERKKRGTTRQRSSYRERERLRSPPRPFETNSFGTPIIDGSHKLAIGPGQAQSLRAVFGAILSHSEIIHDAMACASYLRFITKDTLSEEKHDIIDGVTAEGNSMTSNRSAASLHEESSVDVLNKSPVVIRKKHGSPARNKSWRHSLEVTTPSRYLFDSSNTKLKPLECSSTVSDNTDDPDFTESKHEKNTDTEIKPKDATTKEKLPFAMIALEEVWKFVKSSCSEIIFNEKTSPLTTEHNRIHSAQSSKDEKRCSSLHGGIKLRPQISGRTFFIGTSKNVLLGNFLSVLNLALIYNFCKF